MTFIIIDNTKYFNKISIYIICYCIIMLDLSL